METEEEEEQVVKKKKKKMKKKKKKLKRRVSHNKTERQPRQISPFFSFSFL